jgi:hypothetical protein
MLKFNSLYGTDFFILFNIILLNHLIKVTVLQIIANLDLIKLFFEKNSIY